MPGILENIRAGLERLTTRQKLQMVVAFVGTIVLVWGMSLYANRIRYGILFSGLEPDDASLVVSELKTLNVPYRLTGAGRVVEVPTGEVEELRMQLAGQGLPRGGGVGFEIFDRPTFGISDFVQNVNYRRALERELARSVQSIDHVESARVHLALPTESVYADEQRQPSASVVVRLRGSLPNDRVRAITHLVASGVEGLDSTRVSVVDSDGRMLTDVSDESDGALSSAQVEAKQAIEDRIERILIAILEPLVGPGKARAHATVELETAQVQRVEERYDPDGAVVRSEQKNKSRSGGSGPGGVPGSGSNLPGGSGVGTSSSGADSSQVTTTNFEINKTVATIAEPRGKLLRQSVAVVVDYAVTKTEDAEGKANTDLVPRTPDEMRKITDLVRAAAGIDDSRGDVLIVENVPFDESANPIDLEVGGGFDWIHVTMQILRYLALPLAVALIALLIIRPGIRALQALQAPPARTGLPPTVGELQAQLGETGRLEGGATLRRKLIEAASEDPEAAAMVMRGWLGTE